MALAPDSFCNSSNYPLITTFGGLSGIISVVMSAFEFLGGVLTALSGPVGIVIASCSSDCDS